MGALANHLWSCAGDDDRGDINTTFLQPFLSYTTPTAWTYALQSESFYDWEGRQWLVTDPRGCIEGHAARWSTGEHRRRGQLLGREP